jgi:hypothetical protein
MPAARTHAGRAEQLLSHLAADLREDVIGVATDQAHRANDDDEDHGKHDGIFRHVLPILPHPKIANCVYHSFAPIRRASTHSYTNTAVACLLKYP